MARIRINPYGVSESVTLLNAEIMNVQAEAGTVSHTCMRLASDLSNSQFRGREGELIVNWGSAREIPQNVIGNATLLNNPTAVNLAANKLAAFQRMNEQGVKAVESTTSREVAAGWILEGHHVFCRNELRGHSGAGIVVAAAGEIADVGNVPVVQTLPDAPLYTKGISSQHREYRIHVFKGQVLFIQQKRRANGYRDNPNYSNVVRNHENGWIYGHDNITTPIDAVIIEAVKAVEALGLDFGAVDVLSRQENAWVLEVNTAPGLTGDTNRRNYANAILAVVNNQPVQSIIEMPAIPETTETNSTISVRDEDGRISVGVQVQLSEVGRERYSNTRTNPHNLMGTVFSNRRTESDERAFSAELYYYTVNWSNGGSNNYCDADLEFVDSTNIVPTPTPTPVATAQAAPVAPVHSYQAGGFYILEKSGNRFVGEFCEDNQGFWDTRLEMNYIADVTVIREVQLND